MSKSSLQRILYVEGDEALAHMLKKRMERQQHIHVDLAFSAAEGLARLSNAPYDLVLLDYNLPGISGLETLETMAGMSNMPPAIMLTASSDKNIALAVLEKGAADCVVKDISQTYLDLLPAVMEAAFTQKQLARENEHRRHVSEPPVEKAETANLVKSNFLATISHEIRTPMNVVNGLAHILAKTPLNAEQTKIVQTLQSNADLLLKLINDLLDISRIESGQVELEYTQFTFHEILGDICLMYSHHIQERNISCDMHDETQGMAFIGDRTRIQQIVMNLVSNAFKFTEKGGIRIEVSATPHSDELQKVTVRVCDTGIGIAEDKLATIFNKFTQADESMTRRFGGSGLGLSIALSLARMMGGDITVQTQLGQGSSFIIHLPLKESHSNCPEKFITAGEQKTLTPGGTILLVEDYAPNIMVASMMLEDMGYRVVSATSGAHAIEIVEASPAPFHAILMDVQMDGMDGMETTRRIRELENVRGMRHVIIGVTAHALAGDRERCISAGMDDYISKPIHPDILSAKLSLIKTAD